MFDKNHEIRDCGKSAADVFDWNSIPAVDPMELEKWMNSNDAVERNFPLAIALQVHDEALQRFTAPGKADALQMAECRGAIKALKRFAQIYGSAIGRSTTNA